MFHNCFTYLQLIYLITTYHRTVENKPYKPYRTQQLFTFWLLKSTLTNKCLTICLISYLMHNHFYENNTYFSTGVNDLSISLPSLTKRRKDIKRTHWISLVLCIGGYYENTTYWHFCFVVFQSALTASRLQWKQMCFSGQQVLPMEA